MKNKVVLITNNSKESKLLANKLYENNLLQGLVIENKIKNKNFVNILKKILGEDFLEFLLINFKKKHIKKVLLKEYKIKRKAKANFFKIHPKVPFPNLKYIETNNCNSKPAKDYLKKLKPEIIFIWGTGILSSEIIEIPKKFIINCHFSKLPYYKGTFSEFWICYNKDYSKCGITFHLVNEKIDQGEIIKFIPNNLKGNPYNIRYQNIKLLLSNCSTILEDIFNGETKFSKQKVLSKPSYFRFEDITIDIKKNVYK